MKATHHKLNIVWKAVVRFTVAVRPARSVAQMVSRPHRRLMIGKRWLTLRIASPRYNRRRSGLAVHFTSNEPMKLKLIQTTV